MEQFGSGDRRETGLVRVPETALLAPWPALGKCLTKSVPACRIRCTLVCRGGLRGGGDADVTKKSNTGKSTHRINLRWTFHRFLCNYFIYRHSCWTSIYWRLCVLLCFLIYLITPACTHHLTTHSLFYVFIYLLMHLMYCSRSVCTKAQWLCTYVCICLFIDLQYVLTT